MCAVCPSHLILIHLITDSTCVWDLRFPTAVTATIAVFYAFVTCSPVQMYRHIRGACRRHHQSAVDEIYLSCWGEEWVLSTVMMEVAGSSATSVHP